MAFYANYVSRGRLRMTSPASSHSSAEQSWQQATQLFAVARYAESIPPLKATIAANPDNGTAWAMLGLAEFETKDYDNALLHLQKGASLGLGGSAVAVRLAKYRLALLLIRDSISTRPPRCWSPNPKAILFHRKSNSLSDWLFFISRLFLKLFPLGKPRWSRRPVKFPYSFTTANTISLFPNCKN
jgi:tetratricopeptide (TPR) repeat protein